MKLQHFLLKRLERGEAAVMDPITEVKTNRITDIAAPEQLIGKEAITDPVAHAPKSIWRRGHEGSSQRAKSGQMDKTTKQGVKKVFVSYAWWNTSGIASTEDRQRQELVERLCETVQAEGWQVVRDKAALRYGDLISTFMNVGPS
jgi:hypothetical protein